MKGFYTIILLVISNVFMTLAWYGHLKFEEDKKWSSMGWFALVLVSWGLAFFEYCVQVPANRIGYKAFGGPFSLMELKVIQEVITLLVFLIFTFIFFKSEEIKWNHFVGLACLVGAVYFIFKK